MDLHGVVAVATASATAATTAGIAATTGAGAIVAAGFTRSDTALSTLSLWTCGACLYQRPFRRPTIDDSTEQSSLAVHI